VIHQDLRGYIKCKDTTPRYSLTGLVLNSAL